MCKPGLQELRRGVLWYTSTWQASPYHGNDTTSASPPIPCIFSPDPRLFPRSPASPASLSPQMGVMSHGIVLLSLITVHRRVYRGEAQRASPPLLRRVTISATRAGVTAPVACIVPGSHSSGASPSPPLYSGHPFPRSDPVTLIPLLSVLSLRQPRAT
ncbi:hypothetical protein E2C01_007121 [Portunus trituberculatus]|uniref:Uncharacterized protein n=1 Tax=Portunus trituberculatus TaxID=210409 RepID=A0A5B7CX02_PORTR|nr:hypothetical protein [Portunus trituberculatus]